MYLPDSIDCDFKPGFPTGTTTLRSMIKRECGNNRIVSLIFIIINLSAEARAGEHTRAGGVSPQVSEYDVEVQFIH